MTTFPSVFIFSSFIENTCLVSLQFAYPYPTCSNQLWEPIEYLPRVAHGNFLLFHHVHNCRYPMVHHSGHVTVSTNLVTDTASISCLVFVQCIESCVSSDRGKPWSPQRWRYWAKSWQYHSPLCFSAHLFFLILSAFLRSSRTSSAVVFESNLSLSFLIS